MIVCDNGCPMGGFTFGWASYFEVLPVRCVTGTPYYSENANLSMLKETIYNLQLMPPFNPDITEYTINANSFTQAVYFDAYTDDPLATLNGPVRQNLPVNSGKNTFTFVITAEGGVTQKTYTVVVNKALNDNANLGSLGVLEGYAISPAFNSNITNYTLNVPYSQSSISIYAAAGNSCINATVSGTGSHNLSVGSNTFNITITAENGITKQTYKLVVTRAEQSTNANLQSLNISSSSTTYTLTPAFNENTTSYTLNIPYSQSSINISAQTAYSTASIAAGAVGSKTLSVGNNTFNITVTAEDGVTQKTYTLVVNREAPSTNAKLQSLCINFNNVPCYNTTPAFSPDITEYAASVDFFTTYCSLTISLADSKAVFRADLGDTGYKNLQVGKNTFTITIVAEDGIMQKTYTIIVTREALSEREETINITTPGTLNSTLFADFVSKPITKLTIIGDIDARDIYFLDSLQYLVSLDLSNANIVAYEGTAGWYKSRLYPANELPDYSFNYMPYLTSIILPKTLTSIANVVLNYDATPLTSLTIPEGVTKIGNGFANAKHELTTLTLPSTLTEIGGDSFLYCEKLSTIISHNPNPPDARWVFDRYNMKETTLFVPFGSGASYKAAEVWKEFNIIEMPDMSGGGVSVVPSDSSALIVWQPNENAKGYKLLIYKDEAHNVLIYTLEFGADGRLLNTIRHQAKSAMQTASANLTCTIENLLSGTKYYYTLETLGAGGSVIESKSGTFTTTGEPTGVDVPLAEPVEVTVVEYYNILGAKLPKEPQSGVYIIKYENGKSVKVVK